MGRGKRLKLGNIYEIGLPNGKKAYVRLFKEYTMVFIMIIRKFLL